jgi:hypothetical protein
MMKLLVKSVKRCMFVSVHATGEIFLTKDRERNYF